MVMGEWMFWMLDSSIRISLAMLHKSLASFSFMHSQDFRRPICLSKSVLYEFKLPPGPDLFIYIKLSLSLLYVLGMLTKSSSE